jgi:coiled-coil and C2 domain-containing protein 2A
VPYLEDAALNRRRSDVWTSSADFLSLSAGDAEEHAHLLAGYFLALGQQVGEGFVGNAVAMGVWV